MNLFSLRQFNILIRGQELITGFVLSPPPFLLRGISDEELISGSVADRRILLIVLNLFVS